MIDISFLASPHSLLKLVFLVLIFLFIVFTFIISNQIRSMEKTISLPASHAVHVVGIVLVCASLGLFLLTLAIL